MAFIMQIHYGLLLKDHLPRTHQESKSLERDCNIMVHGAR